MILVRSVFLVLRNVNTKTRNELERAGTRCSYQRLALERVKVISYNGTC